VTADVYGSQHTNDYGHGTPGITGSQMFP
jgi:hypothetical protein